MALEKQKKKASAAPSGVLTRHEKFVTRQVHRSELKNAPYNPRSLSDRAREKLKRSLATFGLVEPPVWNARTGNLVGGHQRISVLDALEKSKDYCLTVAVVDVDDKRERELNIVLNNTSAMGDYDLEKLEGLLKEVNFEDAGFDQADIYQLFGDDFLKQDAAAIAELSEQVREARERYSKIQDTVTDNRDDANFFTVLVFKDRAARDAFSEKIGLEGNKWIDGEYIAARMVANETK
jgi:hypothetical protein